MEWGNLMTEANEEEHELAPCLHLHYLYLYFIGWADLMVHHGGSESREDNPFPEGKTDLCE